MTVTVKLFAILRERAGVSELQLELPAAATITTARTTLGEQFPAIDEYLARVAWAVNRSYAPVATELHDRDELAVIPPVSGG